MALDQSSRITGWSIFINGKLTKWGKFEAEDEDIGKRLFYIRNQILHLINENNINYIAFEDIQFQDKVINNVQTFKALAEVFGIVYELCVELNIEHKIIPSVTWKSALQIKGTKRPEQKKNAQKYVFETYNLKVTQDESDAICIGASLLKEADEEEGFNWA